MLVLAIVIAVLVFIIVGLSLWLYALGHQEPFSHPRFALRLVRLTRGKRLAEDILKVLHGAHARQETLDAHAVAQALHVRPGRVLRSLHYLAARGLVSLSPPVLTEAGLSYAVQLLRYHRLVETYLSEYSGIRPDNWHAAAERLEHQLDATTAEVLERQLGYPRFDPHGDPIPSAQGELRHCSGVPLSTVPNHRALYRVEHLDDKDAAAFHRIMELGFYVGVPIELRSAGDDGVQVQLEDRIITLSEVLAHRVMVVPTEEEPLHGVFRLSQLAEGEVVEVVGITPACLGQNRRRLLDLGFVPGSAVRIDLISPLGNPVAYLIRGTSIALRHDQAFHIQVRRREPSGPTVAPQQSEMSHA